MACRVTQTSIVHPNANIERPAWPARDDEMQFVTRISTYIALTWFRSGPSKVIKVERLPKRDRTLIFISQVHHCYPHPTYHLPIFRRTIKRTTCFSPWCQPSHLPRTAARPLPASTESTRTVSAQTVWGRSLCNMHLGMESFGFGTRTSHSYFDAWRRRGILSS
jgi:hypothetical protein